MAKASKATLIAEYNNMFETGLISAEVRDQLIEKLGSVKVKTQRPAVDTSVYGEPINGSNPARAATFIKGLEYVDMPESERPEYCQFQVYYRGKGDDLPKLVIDFYTTRRLSGIIKLIDGKYVLMQKMMTFADIANLEPSERKHYVSEKLYQLCLRQRNYDAQLAGEAISGKAEQFISDDDISKGITLSEPKTKSEPAPEPEPVKTTKVRKAAK